MQFPSINANSILQSSIENANVIFLTTNMQNQHFFTNETMPPQYALTNFYTILNALIVIHITHKKLNNNYKYTPI